MGNYIFTVVENALAEVEKATGREIPYSALLARKFEGTVATVMRDQRHACAEAVIRLHSGRLVPDGADYISKNEAHQAVMNAEVK